MQYFLHYTTAECFKNWSSLLKQSKWNKKHEAVNNIFYSNDTALTTSQLSFVHWDAQSALHIHLHANIFLNTWLEVYLCFECEHMLNLSKSYL